MQFIKTYAQYFPCLKLDSNSNRVRDIEILISNHFFHSTITHCPFMLKINIAIPKTIKARINERDVKSRAKRNLELDQIRCVSKQPIIEMSKKRPLASLESLGKRTKKRTYHT